MPFVAAPLQPGAGESVLSQLRNGLPVCGERTSLGARPERTSGPDAGLSGTPFFWAVYSAKALEGLLKGSHERTSERWSL